MSAALTVAGGLVALWVLFWMLVCILDGPLTWLLYAVGEHAERRGWT